MLADARFGRTLTLVEALRADPSPYAAALADLLEPDEIPLAFGFSPARCGIADDATAGITGCTTGAAA